MQNRASAANLARLREKLDLSAPKVHTSIRRFTPAVREGTAKTSYPVALVRFCSDDSGCRFSIGAWHRVSGNNSCRTPSEGGQLSPSARICSLVGGHGNR